MVLYAGVCHYMLLCAYVQPNYGNRFPTVHRWVCDDDQVRLLSDPNRLVANEVQILMYHRRNQLKDSNASGPTPWSSSQAASRGTTMDRQGPNLTRTRVLFGEDGSIVSTVREPAGAGW